MKWADLDPPASWEETNRWPTPKLVATARRARERAAKLRAGPTYRLRVLAYQEPGASVLLDQYRKPAQLGAALKNCWLHTGALLESEQEYSVIDGATIGVRVTLIKRATRGAVPLSEDEIAAQLREEQRASKEARAAADARESSPIPSRRAPEPAPPPLSLGELLK